MNWTNENLILFWGLIFIIILSIILSCSYSNNKVIEYMNTDSNNTPKILGCYNVINSDKAKKKNFKRLTNTFAKCISPIKTQFINQYKYLSYDPNTDGYKSNISNLSSVISGFSANDHVNISITNPINPKQRLFLSQGRPLIDKNNNNIVIGYRANLEPMTDKLEASIVRNKYQFKIMIMTPKCTYLDVNCNLTEKQKKLSKFVIIYFIDKSNNGDEYVNYLYDTKFYCQDLAKYHSVCESSLLMNSKEIGEKLMSGNFNDLVFIRTRKPISNKKSLFQIFNNYQATNLLCNSNGNFVEKIVFPINKNNCKRYLKQPISVSLGMRFPVISISTEKNMCDAVNLPNNVQIILTNCYGYPLRFSSISGTSKYNIKSIPISDNTPLESLDIPRCIYKNLGGNIIPFFYIQKS